MMATSRGRWAACEVAVTVRTELKVGSITENAGANMVCTWKVTVTWHRL